MNGSLYSSQTHCVVPFYLYARIPLTIKPAAAQPEPCNSNALSFTPPAAAAPPRLPGRHARGSGGDECVLR